MKKRKSARKSGAIKAVIVVATFVALIAITASIIIAKKFTPTSERMSGYSYFDIDENTKKVLVIVDGTKYADMGVYVDDRLYVSRDFIVNNINPRFYYDKETDSVMYSDTKHIYSMKSDSKEYKDESGASYNSEAPVVVKEGNDLYLDWKYVAEHSNCMYEEGKDPARLSVITSNYGDILLKRRMKDSGVTDKDEVALNEYKADADVKVRYRGGIKSPILEDISKGTRLIEIEDLDDWIKVLTPSGIEGYVQKKYLTGKSEYVWEDTFVEKYDRYVLQGKVNLGWFQVGGTAGNNSVDNFLSNQANINVISPTWYSITGNDGSMSCFASKSFVSDMHNRGLQVWALISDFDKNVDFKELYSSKSARTKMINTLVSDAKSYGFDGINLDCELIKSDFAKDYLQFVRELSVRCEAEGIILSSDNYKPEAYNQCYNLKEQAAFVDYIIIMAYDEHPAGSTQAGSVSSLPFVKEAIEDTVALVPASQVVVGVPFYTRIWTTKDGKTSSRDVGMQTAIDTLNADGQVALWNDDCSQYVVSYQSGGATKQIWFEEEKSMEAKVKVISEANVAGIAEWKLGLEKTSVWPIIGNYAKQ